MPEQASKAFVKSLVNEDLKLEYQASRRVQENLAAVRNNLLADLQANPNNWNANRLAPVLDEYLKEFERQSVEGIDIPKHLVQGTNEGRLIIGEAAQIPKGSAYWGWAPTIPINAISLLEAEATSRITKVSSQVKDQILRKVQVGLAQGVPIGQLQDDILGVGLRGSKGRDGVFRSASVRAETIARTTSNELINKGALNTYNQVADKVPELGLKKVWQTLSDNRTSDRCIALSNQIQPLDKPFSAAGWQGEHPPAHPNCRSRVTVLSERYSEEWNNRFPAAGTQPSVALEAAKKLSKRKPKSTKAAPRSESNTPLNLPSKTAISSDPAITTEALAQALSQLPKEQYELINKFLNKTELQSVFTDPFPDADKILADLKFRGSLTYRNRIDKSIYPKSGKDASGKPVLANGYTSSWYNHVQVRLRGPLEDFKVDVNQLQMMDSRVLMRARNQPNSLRWSFSEMHTAGDPNQIFSTYLHELGHQIQYKSGRTSVPSGVQYFTDYGNPANSFSEWHAESFRLWAVSPEAYKKEDPIGFQYIDSMVRQAADRPSFDHIPTPVKITTKLGELHP